MNSSAERFTECWHTEGPRVRAYALRHIGSDDAHDVVAETFTIAWRRWDEVPDPAIGWLLTTARGVVSNRRRTQRRQRALEDRIAHLDQVAAQDTSEAVVTRHEAVRRLAALTEEHREALLLTSWDGLSSEEAAGVLGIRPATFRRRLSRARGNLAKGLDPPDGRASDAHRFITSQETT